MQLGGTKKEITKDGARWIFIYEKFNQFIYGFIQKNYIGDQI